MKLHLSHPTLHIHEIVTNYCYLLNVIYVICHGSVVKATHLHPANLASVPIRVTGGSKKFVCLFVCLVFNGSFSTNRLYCAIEVWSISRRAREQHKNIMQLNKERIQQTKIVCLFVCFGLTALSAQIGYHAVEVWSISCRAGGQYKNIMQRWCQWQWQ